MKLKIEFVAFQSSIIAPGSIGSEQTLTKSTKYPDVEMEYDTEGHLIIKLTKDSKGVMVPAMNIKSMVLAEQPKK